MSLSIDVYARGQSVRQEVQPDCEHGRKHDHDDHGVSEDVTGPNFRQAKQRDRPKRLEHVRLCIARTVCNHGSSRLNTEFDRGVASDQHSPLPLGTKWLIILPDSHTLIGNVAGIATPSRPRVIVSESQKLLSGSQKKLLIHLNIIEEQERLSIAPEYSIFVLDRFIILWFICAICGIAGAFGSGNKFVLSEMVSCIRHRGPDETGE